MLWLWILLGVIAFFAIIGFLSLTLDIKAGTDECVVDAKYAFLRFRIYPDKKRKKKKIKNKKLKKSKIKDKQHLKAENDIRKYNQPKTDISSELKKESKQEVKAKKKKNKKKKHKKEHSFEDISQFFKMIDGLPRKILNLIKKIRITEFELYMDVGGEDAYETALNFGKTNAAVWSLVGIAKGLFNLSIKKINITCNYESEETTYKLRTKIKVRVFTLVVFVIGVFIKILLNQRKGKVEENARN